MSANLDMTRDDVRKLKHEQLSQIQWNSQQFGSKEEIERLKQILNRIEDETISKQQSFRIEMQHYLQSKAIEFEESKISQSDLRVLEDRILNRLEGKIQSQQQMIIESDGRIEQLQTAVETDLKDLKSSLTKKNIEISEQTKNLQVNLEEQI